MGWPDNSSRPRLPSHKPQPAGVTLRAKDPSPAAVRPVAAIPPYVSHQRRSQPVPPLSFVRQGGPEAGAGGSARSAYSARSTSSSFLSPLASPIVNAARVPPSWELPGPASGAPRDEARQGVKGWLGSHQEAEKPYFNPPACAATELSVSTKVSDSPVALASHPDPVSHLLRTVLNAREREHLRTTLRRSFISWRLYAGGEVLRTRLRQAGESHSEELASSRAALHSEQHTRHRDLQRVLRNAFKLRDRLLTVLETERFFSVWHRACLRAQLNRIFDDREMLPVLRQSVSPQLSPRKDCVGNGTPLAAVRLVPHYHMGEVEDESATSNNLSLGTDGQQSQIPSAGQESPPATPPCPDFDDLGSICDRGQLPSEAPLGDDVPPLIVRLWRSARCAEQGETRPCTEAISGSASPDDTRCFPNHSQEDLLAGSFASGGETGNDWGPQLLSSLKQSITGEDCTPVLKLQAEVRFCEVEAATLRHRLKDAMTEEGNDEAAVREYASFLGIDTSSEPELMWIAQEGLRATVCPPWFACADGGGSGVFYVNTETRASAWVNPLDSEWRALVSSERKAPTSRTLACQAIHRSHPREGVDGTRLGAASVVASSPLVVAATPPVVFAAPPPAGFSLTQSLPVLGSNERILEQQPLEAQSAELGSDVLQLTSQLVVQGVFARSTVAVGDDRTDRSEDLAAQLAHCEATHAQSVATGAAVQEVLTSLLTGPVNDDNEQWERLGQLLCEFSVEASSPSDGSLSGTEAASQLTDRLRTSLRSDCHKHVEELAASRCSAVHGEERAEARAEALVSELRAARLELEAKPSVAAGGAYRVAEESDTINESPEVVEPDDVVLRFEKIETTQQSPQEGQVLLHAQSVSEEVRKAAESHEADELVRVRCEFDVAEACAAAAREVQVEAAAVLAEESHTALAAADAERALRNRLDAVHHGGELNELLRAESRHTMWEEEQASSTMERALPSTTVAPCALGHLGDADPDATLPIHSREVLLAAARRIWTLRTELAMRDRERDRVAELRSELAEVRAAQEPVSPSVANAGPPSLKQEDLRQQLGQLQSTLVAGAGIAESLSEAVGSPEVRKTPNVPEGQLPPSFKPSFKAKFDARELPWAAEVVLRAGRHIADLQREAPAPTTSKRIPPLDISSPPLVPGCGEASGRHGDNQGAAEPGSGLASGAAHSPCAHSDATDSAEPSSSLALDAARSPRARSAATDGSDGAASFMTAADSSEARPPESPTTEAHAGVQRWRRLAAALSACKRRRCIRGGAVADEDVVHDMDAEEAEMGRHAVTLNQATV